MWSTWLTAAKTGKVLILHICLSQSQITLPWSLKILCPPQILFISLAIMTKMNLSLGNWCVDLENCAFPLWQPKHTRPLFFRNCEPHANGQSEDTPVGFLRLLWVVPDFSCFLGPLISAAVWQHCEWACPPWNAISWNSRINSQNSLF